MKRIISIILVALVCLTLVAGCAGNPPAATIGDKVVTVAQLKNMYESNSTYSTYYGFTLTSDEAIEDFQDYLLNMMVETKVKQYKAEQAGITLTDEELKEAQATATKTYDDTYQTFLDAAKEQGASNVRAHANSLFTDALSRNHTTVSKMKKEYLSQAKGDLMIAKYKTQLMEGVEANAEDIKKIYDEQLAAQKESFDADTAAYFTQDAYGMYGYDTVPLYIPAGLVRVRQILVEEEATANEVLAKLNADGDFDELLKEYNTDPGMETNPKGYLVGEGASYVEAFLNASLALKKDGEISPIVQSEYGYHIIQRVGEEKGGVVPYADVKESFETFAKSKFSENYYTALVADWMREEGLVTYHYDNFRSIGKK